MPFKVVYLDDEPELCEIFSDMIATDDIEVKTFTDPAQAIEFINANTPGAVFLDFRLPNTTGETVAAQLKSSIPKVLVSGDLQVSTKFDFEHVLSKPIDFDLVMQLIESFRKKN